MKHKKTELILTSKTSVKFANKNEQDNIIILINEYQVVCQKFIEILWEEKELPRLITKDHTSQINSWLSQRMIQCCAKQASGIIRGTRQKNKQREHIYQKMLSDGWTKKAKKLKRIIDQNKFSKPNIKNICPELDSRFIQFDFDNQTSFDGWINITSIGNKIKIEIPVKRTKHFNKLNELGELKKGIRLSRNDISFNFEIKKKVEKEENIENLQESPIIKEIPKEKKLIGIDIGVHNIYALSNGFMSPDDPYGWNLDKINDRLSRREKGSNGFRRAQELRKNYVGWSLNRINFDEIEALKCERLHDVRRGKTSSRKLSHWNYKHILDLLERKCFLEDVPIYSSSPTYTSQRCSCCGWVRKSNRKGKIFKCGQCGLHIDADLNASRNLALCLPAISRKERLKKMNIIGFYWCRNNNLDRKNKISYIDPLVQENIVPEALKV